MAQGGSAGSPPVLEGTPTHEERALLPTVRQEHSAAALGGEVYVIGGFTPSVSASLQAYSPEGDEWREVADFPEALHHANAAVVGDTLYVLGFNRGGSFTDIDGRVFAYDPGTNQWTGRTSMPTGTERASSCVAALGTEIYVFGGSVNTAGNSTTVVDSSVYDTVADEWEDLPPMPEAREHCLAGAVGGMLYIVSGRSGGIAGLEPESWAFDPEARQFEERAPIPTPRGGAAGAVLGGRIYVFGGEGNDADSEGVFHEVEAYDPSTDQWEELPDMLIARHGYAAAAVGDRIYLPGGAINEGFGANDAHTVFFLE
jgi:N-acetylneuraminic acid mutarotase